MNERKPIPTKVALRARPAAPKASAPAAKQAAKPAAPKEAKAAPAKARPKAGAASPAAPEPLGIQSRRTERSMLMLDPLLLDKDGRVVARVADISIDGAAIYSKGDPFPAGSQLSGWLDAPALGAFDEEFVAVWMTVAWSRPEGPSGWFKAGCVFEHEDDHERERLATLIEALRSPK